jgi:hypothetical protein
MKLATALQCAGNQLLNAVLHKSPTAPSSPVEGQIYWDTLAKKFMVYNGTGWSLTGVQLTTNAPQNETVGAAAAVGTAPTAAREDHVHAMPGIATDVLAGFLSAADKLKLDSATSASTPTTLAIRDAAGRLQVADPALDGDVATLGWVNSTVAPLATRVYVDNAVQGLDAKQSVRAASVANIANLSGLLTIDGVQLVAGNRVLVKDQTAPAANGIYVAASGAWSRATDADSWNELVNAYCWVEEGTTQGDTGWVSTVDAGLTLNTDPVTFVLFSSSGGAIEAGAGLTKTSNMLSVNTDGVTVVLNAANKLSVKTDGTNGGLDWTHFLTGAKDGDPLNPTLRTLGTGANQAAAGNHTHIGLYAQGFAATIGDGVDSSFTVNHALASTNVIVMVKEVATGLVVLPDIAVQDANNVVISFSAVPSNNSYSVVVFALHG